jgi:hypothetical protein
LGAEEFCTGRELEVIDFDRTRNLMLAGVGGPGVLHDGASDDGLPPVRADRPVRVVINRVHSHPSWDGMLAKPFDILRKKFSVLRKWNARLQARLARRSGSHLAAVALTAVPFGLYNLPYAARDSGSGTSPSAPTSGGYLMPRGQRTTSYSSSMMPLFS